MNPRAYLSVVVILISIAGLAGAAPDVGFLDFTSDQWVKDNAQVVEHLGRTSLIGHAVLKDAVFEDGTIEFDIAVDGRRSYPGVLFRMEDQENYERVYVRPHRAGLYSDAIQYLPAFNGADSWQLYNGEGFTAPVQLPKDEWIHIKLEVSGTQARFYVGVSAQPALVIHELKRGDTKGTLGLNGPMDRSAFFSNFRYRTEVGEPFDPPRPKEWAPGAIAEWELSQPYPLSVVDIEAYPDQRMLTGVTWRKAVCEPSGLVDVSRVQPRTMRGYETILARTTIDAAAAETRRFDIGYSDIVSVFLNGTLVYSANSTYQLRDPSFLGVVGPFDALYLPLRKGKNELLLCVTEIMGGWGFLVRDGTVVYQDKSMARLWEIDRAFAFPESAAYDPKGRVVFVSSFDPFNRSVGEGMQSVAKLSPDGRILEKDWAKGLFNPTGLVIRGDRLYAVERKGVVEIDTATGKVLKRHQIPEPLMPNDITIDGSGTIYVSDSVKSVVYRIADGTVEEWLKGDEIRTPNGLCIRGSELIIGNNGDFSLKAVGLSDRKVRTVARLAPGIIDGIAVDKGGNLLVSHYDGRLYRIAPDGGITKLLDTSTLGRPIADFGYDAETGRFFIPTFIENGLIAYQHLD